MKMSSFRSRLTRNFDIARLLVSVGIGVLFAIVIILIISDEPGNAIQKLFLGPLQSKRRFGNVIELMIPLTFTGLSITVMFSANQFNLGAEGAFYASGGLAAIIALAGAGTPAGLHPLVCILAGAVLGGIICAVSGLLKLKFSTSELVASLMLNYIFYYLFKYIVFTLFKDPTSGYISTYKFPNTARLSTIVQGTRIHTGVIFMVLAVFLCYVYMRHTRWGYELKLTGENQNFARFSGVNVGMVMLVSQFIGGVAAGAGGAIQALGMYERFQWTALPGYGFDGVIVAILARKNPLLVPVAAFFLAYLRIGSDVMSSSSDVTNEIISIIQSVIILFVSAKVFLDTFRQKMVVKEAADHE